MYAKSATTITNILEAAQALFVSKNYADVTMSEIAEAANVTKGALYHHFNSKEDLYVGMMLSDLAEKQSLLGEVTTLTGSCQERLSQLTINYLNLPHEQRELIRLVRRDINIFKDPIRQQLIRAYQAALPEQVEKIIREGIEAGELAETDARLLAWQYVAMVEVLLSSYAQSVLGSSASRLAEYVLDLFFNGARVAETLPETRFL
jgi:AcrR family transcriptional regulator